MITFVLKKTLFVILPALCTLSLNSCRTPSVAVQPAPAPPLYDWKGDGVSGPLKVNISLEQQKAQLFKGGENVGWTYVATGREGYDTPRGTFHILEKVADKHSNKYGVLADSAGNVTDWDAAVGRESIPPGQHFVAASMPNWMRLTGYGVGMHAGQIPNPGHPASHGCIRLPQFISQKLFENAVLGTIVAITP